MTYTSLATDIDKYLQYDSTPLMAAAANGHLEVARLLVEMGANLEAVDKVETELILYRVHTLKFFCNIHMCVVFITNSSGVDCAHTQRC